MRRNLIAAELMRHLCEHDWHGYTQGSGRWGDGEGYCTVELDGKTYYLAQGDRDCSSAVISCWQAAGVDVQATYTGDMLAGFLATGLFEKQPLSFTAQPGDIYLNYSDHTAMCISSEPDLLGEFCINEFGDVTGGLVGDQTGYEAYIHGYYDFPWNCILHYIGESEDDLKPADVWEYSYKPYPPRTDNVYNTLIAIDEALNVPHESANGDGVAGSLVDRVDWIDGRVREMDPKLDKLQASIDALIKLCER